MGVFANDVSDHCVVATIRDTKGHFHHGAERGLSVPCRAGPVFGCASTRPSSGPGGPFSPLFWPDKIVVLSGPTNRAESGSVC